MSTTLPSANPLRLDKMFTLFPKQSTKVFPTLPVEDLQFSAVEYADWSRSFGSSVRWIRNSYTDDNTVQNPARTRKNAGEDPITKHHRG